MTALPAPIVEYLSSLIVQGRHPSYLRVDEGGRLAGHGGNLDHYGLAGVEKGRPVEDQVDYLFGFFPMPEPLDPLAAIETATGIKADIHFLVDDASVWVVFLDASSEVELQVQLQQQAYDATLTQVRQARTLSRYLGKDIAEQIQRDNAQLSHDGERRVIATLFADLSGFTSYSEHKEPCQVFRALNRYLSVLLEPVIECGGSVDKIIGDCVMGLFGIVPAETSPADQALETAVRMLGAINTLNQREQGDSVNEDAHSWMDVSVGIATGEVAIGILGTREHRSYSVIGHHVNLAARLEKEARPGEVIIDESTYSMLADPDPRFNKLRFEVKGVADSVEAYSLYPNPGGRGPNAGS